MRKFKKAKGFTLVELLVVVAILAVLATVTTISYFAFTSRAKESNDISLTAQMNTVLQGNEAVDGKAKTMSQALKVLSDAGLDVTKLSPISDGYSYVYDSDSGKMLLLNKDKEIVAPEDAVDTNKTDTFAIVKTEDELSNWLSADYGIYFANGYTGSTELNSLTSVDVGDTNIKALTINDETSTDSVLINAYLDNLNLNVPNGSVNFYGDVTTAEATTADHSLHVYGHIQQLNVLGGKVVVENSGEVNTIDATNVSKNVSISKENNGKIGAVIANDNEKVTADSNIDIIDSSTIEEGFSGGIGTEESPYLVSNEDEFYNIASLSDKMLEGKEYFFLQTKDLEINNYATKYFRGTFDGNGKNITVSSESEEPVVTLFLYTLGDTVIKNVNTYSREDKPLSYTYEVAATRSLTFMDCTSNVVDNKILKIDQGNFGFFVWYSIMDNRSTNVGIFPDTSGKLTCVESDLDGQQTVSFANCINYGSVQNTGNCTAVFVGQAIYPDTKIVIKDSINYGNIIGASQAGLINGNSSGFNNSVAWPLFKVSDFELSNLQNYGYISAENANIFSDGNKGFSQNFIDLISGNGRIESNKNNAISNINFHIYYENNNFFVKESTTTQYSYKLVLKVQEIRFGSDGVSNGRNLIIDLAKESVNEQNELSLENNVHAYNAKKAVELGIISQDEANQLEFKYELEKYNVALYQKDGKMYIIFENIVSVDSNVNTYIFAYDSSETLVGTKLL